MSTRACCFPSVCLRLSVVPLLAASAAAIAVPHEPGSCLLPSAHDDPRALVVAARSESGDEALPLHVAADTPSGGLKWIVALYMWMYGMDGTVTVHNVDADVDVGFDDILENLDFALQGHVECWSGQWGGFFDGQYGELSGDGTVGPIGAEVTSTLAVIELGVARRFFDRTLEESSDRHFTADALLGARYYGLGAEIDFDPPALSTIDRDQDWVDGFVGARCQWDFAKRFTLGARGDVGGFDIGDASDLAWQAEALFGWRMGKSATLAAGYRILDVDYDHGGFGYDVRLSGPLIGVAFRL